MVVVEHATETLSTANLARDLTNLRPNTDAPPSETLVIPFLVVALSRSMIKNRFPIRTPRKASIRFRPTCCTHSPPGDEVWRAVYAFV